MKAKEVLGLILTVISIIVIVAGFAMYGGNIKDPGVAFVTALMGFAVILLGPWLWLGEVPVAVRKFVEARTGRKLGEGEKK